MGVIDIASSKSVWRGMEYYKQNKEKSRMDRFLRFTEKSEAAKV